MFEKRETGMLVLLENVSQLESSLVNNSCSYCPHVAGRSKTYKHWTKIQVKFFVVLQEMLPSVFCQVNGSTFKLYSPGGWVSRDRIGNWNLILCSIKIKKKRVNKKHLSVFKK